VALTCHVIKVETNMLLQYRFEAKGKVDLSGSKITGQLVCASGRFLAKGLALNCDAITVGVYVFLRNGFKAQGTIHLTRAEIAGDLDLRGAILREGFIAQGMRMGA
jgi:hypothetical protein